ncbi:hypothetical protein [Kribbella sp. HUAS MG21]|uniref:Lsr2 protein n=1 Tax=Kribbella sp. HUAS MG21 TaxID=3160966 RepID=A0AAU7TEF3_9ACTN
MGEHKDKPIFWFTDDGKPTGELTVRATVDDVHEALGKFLRENEQVKSIEVKLPIRANLRRQDVEQIAKAHNLRVEIVKSSTATEKHR